MDRQERAFLASGGKTSTSQRKRTLYRIAHVGAFSVKVPSRFACRLGVMRAHAHQPPPVPTLAHACMTTADCSTEFGFLQIRRASICSSELFS